MNSVSAKAGTRAAIGAVVLGLLGGCATTDMSNTQKQGTAIGAAGGAAVGAVIGKQIGGDRGMIIGGAIGAIYGALIGKSWADEVEETRRKYQNEQERIAASIRVSTRIQEDLQKENAALVEKVAVSQKRVDRLKTDIAAKKVEKDQVTKEKERIGAETKKVDAKIEDLKKAHAGLTEIHAKIENRDTATVAELGAQIAALEKQRAALEKSRNELVEQNLSLEV